MRLRVVRLSTFLDYGGIESKMVKLSRIEQDLFDFYFCSIGRGGDAELSIKDNGGTVFCLNTHHRIGSIWTFLKVARLIIKVKPDVVHCSGSEAVFYGVLASRIFRVKKIVAEEIGIPKPSRLTSRVLGFVYSLAHKVVGESSVVCDAVIRNYSVKPEKTVVVHNFIDSKETNLYSVGKFTAVTKLKLLTICRLEPVKNIEGVLYALSILAQEGFNFEYHVVGDGSQKDALIEITCKLGLAEFVHFHGYVEKPWRIYANVDLFVMNSNSEGFSNSLLEAMSLNLPVISTRVGGAVDVLVDKENGWLVSVGDSSSLVSALKEFWSLSVDQRCLIGARAGCDVRSKFSSSRHISDLSSLYSSI